MRTTTEQTLPDRSRVVPIADALVRLHATEGTKFIELFEHGSLSVEVYRPGDVDEQEPHDRDELYVVVSGRGTLRHGQQRTSVVPGDFLFVPAGLEHRFEDFTPDLTLWAIFYGPEGGEAA